jgi:PAS domain S-box-containing protein
MSDLDPAVLRELLDEALVMLWTSGPDGRGTWVNRRWEEFTGAGYGDVTWADCVEPQDLARLRPRFQDALLAQRGYNMEYRMRRHDGVYRWVLATATPRFAEDGTFLGYLGSSVDITDRRESERQLREGSLAMRTLYEVIAQVDRPFGEQIEALLLVGCQVFQMDAGLLIQADGNVLHSAAFEESSRDRGARLLARQPVPALFGRSPSPVHSGGDDGTLFGIGLWTGDALWGALAFSSARPAHNFGNFDREFVRLMATWISSAVVREHAREKRRELDEAIRSAQRLESLGMLAGGIAHDFNNLLTGVLNNAEVALEDAKDPELRECIQDIRVAAIRAAELTSQLLAYAGRRKVRSRAVDLDTIIRESQPILAPALAQGAQLELDLKGGSVLGERTPLRQIVVNLVMNASEANASRVRVSTSRAHDLSEEFPDLPAGRYVLLTVSDDGDGMDESTRSRIFEPFFTTKFSGRGLGLAAVMGLVHQLGGELLVDSRPGVGTVFSIALPASMGDEVAEMPTQDLLPAMQAEGLVLVIDDEYQVLRTLKRILTRLGFEVVTASSGRSGLEKLTSMAEKPRLVVLDIVMPEMDGAETLRRLRAIDSDIPVLLTSGFAMKEVVDRFDMDQVAGFVPKPFQRRRLLAELMKVLDA